MSETMTCAVAADGERVHRYVAGTLAPEEVAEFETHVLGCAECQAAVREGATVRSALRAAPIGRATGRTARRPLWWAVPLAVAAGASVWLVAGREGALARLGRVAVAPEFAGVTVRSDADSTSRLTDSGMAAYSGGRYREAARLLVAVPAEERTPGVRFYLGVATLLDGAPAQHVGDDVPCDPVDECLQRGAGWHPSAADGRQRAGERLLHDIARVFQVAEGACRDDLQAPRQYLRQGGHRRVGHRSVGGSHGGRRYPATHLPIGRPRKRVGAQHAAPLHPHDPTVRLQSASTPSTNGLGTAPGTASAGGGGGSKPSGGSISISW